MYGPLKIAPVPLFHEFLNVTGSTFCQYFFGTGTMACDVVPARFETTKNGSGAFRVNWIVRSSTAVTDATSFLIGIEKLSNGAWVISMLMVNTTSSDVSGLPSLHSVPGLRVTVHWL